MHPLRLDRPRGVAGPCIRSRMRPNVSSVEPETLASDDTRAFGPAPARRLLATANGRAGRAFFSSTVFGRRACRSSRGPCGDAGNNPCRRQGDRVVALTSSARCPGSDDHPPIGQVVCWKITGTPVSAPSLRYAKLAPPTSTVSVGACSYVLLTITVPPHRPAGGESPGAALGATSVARLMSSARARRRWCLRDG